MELRKLAEAVELYVDDHNGVYPADETRKVPADLEPYLPKNYWPPAAWPGSDFDWDNWGPDPTSSDPSKPTYQISIRFCPYGGTIDQCHFPNEPWAKDFVVDSAAYYCISGPCQAHEGENVPGYCIGGACPP